MMSNVEYCDLMIHTDKKDINKYVAAENATQFILLMCADNATVSFRFGKNLDILADTPHGEYRFIFESAPSEDLVIDQVM